jgi:hypothetical protein
MGRELQRPLHAAPAAGRKVERHEQDLQCRCVTAAKLLARGNAEGDEPRVLVGRPQPETL